MLLAENMLGKVKWTTVIFVLCNISAMCTEMTKTHDIMIGLRPTFLLMNVFIALKGSHFWFLFDFTAAGVVPCGGRKTSPRTSTIVQFIFYFGPLRSVIIFRETHILDRFFYLFGPILIYISLWFNCLFEIRKITVFPLAFIAGWLQGHWWGFISRNYVVWPTFLLMNVFIALKGSHFWFLFDFTAAGVVPCGGRKTSPRTSTIVQFIFYFGPLRSVIIFWEIRNKWLV